MKEKASPRCLGDLLRECRRASSRTRALARARGSNTRRIEEGLAEKVGGSDLGRFGGGTAAAAVGGASARPPSRDKTICGAASSRSLEQRQPPIVFRVGGPGKPQSQHSPHPESFPSLFRVFS